eukprot:TRINITY_DN42127_c0_g1_i1.p1 TRINITY_DN42127_c0_g1~~TRINITY_DN42127_c0_g1_i1.p1  ORF type:complete len:215 (+),score=23.89 TRINITY_DN42127_c0_g1_i1:196-840(+)
MDLDSNVQILQVREYLDKVAKYRHQPAYSITMTGDGQGRPLPRTVGSADHLGPGHYPTDRDFPTGKRLDEHGVGVLTRSNRSPIVTAFSSEGRGRIHDPRYPGPGDYRPRPPGALSMENRDPRWTVPLDRKDKDRPLPRAKTAGDLLGPGSYQVQNRFDDLGWRKQMSLEKAARHNKEHWATKEWSHVLKCMRPTKPRGTASSPSLPPAPGAKT